MSVWLLNWVWLMKDGDVNIDNSLTGISLVVSYLQTKFFQALEKLLMENSVQVIIRICFGVASTW